ncbi:MAG: ATP-dependent Clp protease adapter ClpS [Proteobacteria bacterium]|nr:ATP-dependent Clp protease adapter ClpS [Pseudomonadota bacterium]MBU1708938.1 ATP-dependent Clp protease adapter ClpS [Pseudomonadota bacterium]
MSHEQKDLDGQAIVEQRQEVEEPPLFKVLLHNDDYTTMDFVVMILEAIFHKTKTEATAIMLTVHNHGVGVAGVFPREIADTKMTQVNEYARQNEHPLKCTIEKA